mmetsp:Transcript_41638/g.130023  ORF Transcript_41638/g.130023 Transcript_41638/m.130023 type:complete len:281 (-) Transcript_41638:1045-1887(-)
MQKTGCEVGAVVADEHRQRAQGVLVGKGEETDVVVRLDDGPPGAPHVLQGAELGEAAAQRRPAPALGEAVQVRRRPSGHDLEDQAGEGLARPRERQEHIRLAGQEWRGRVQHPHEGYPAHLGMHHGHRRVNRLTRQATAAGAAPVRERCRPVHAPQESVPEPQESGQRPALQPQAHSGGDVATGGLLKVLQVAVPDANHVRKALGSTGTVVQDDPVGDLLARQEGVEYPGPVRGKERVDQVHQEQVSVRVTSEAPGLQQLCAAQREHDGKDCLACLSTQS